MNPKFTQLTADDQKWMPPQSLDMVHPAEEVGKGTVVLLTAFMMCCRVLLADSKNANCSRGEWDLFVIPIIVVYLLVFFGCLGHDLLRLRTRARGSMRRRLAIVRLIVGVGTTALLVYSLARPNGASTEENDGCGTPPLPASSFDAAHSRPITL